MMRTHTINCPNCQQPYELRSEKAFQNCPHCDCRLVIGFRFKFNPEQSHLPVYEREVIDIYAEAETYAHWIEVRGLPASERFKDTDFH